MAPHLAARLEGHVLSLDPLVAAFRALDGDFAVVEGVGGFRVPLFDHVDTADMARAFGLPVVLVVGMRLGCLNHALLSARAIEAEGLPLAGWIANTIDPAMPVADENIATLRDRLRAPLLGILPHQAPPDAERLSRHLDVSPLLP